MTESENAPPATKGPLTGKPLSVGERSLAIVLGAAVMGAGITAIFVKNNGTGALALILVGAVFLLVGVTGVIVTSLKVGDNEVVLERVRQAQAAFAQGDTKTANAIVQELASPTSSNVTLVPEALDRSRYEQSVLNVVSSNLPQGWLLEQDKEASDYRFDAYLVSPTGKGIVCEIFVTTRFTGGQLSRSIESARDNKELRIDGVLIVSRNDTAALKSLQKKMDNLHIPARIVAWSGDNSTEGFRSALAELLPAVEGLPEPDPPEGTQASTPPQ
jgi:hypothetical protein